MNVKTYIGTIQLGDLTVEVHELENNPLPDSHAVKLQTKVGKFLTSVAVLKTMLKDKAGTQVCAAMLKRKLKEMVWQEFAQENNIKP